MIAPADCAVIVLAAGRSERFGSGQKLMADLLGRPLAAHIARTLSRLDWAQKLAVTADDAVSALFADQGFTIVTNPSPEHGQSHSLRLGIDAARDAKATLVCLADMPFITVEHLRALLDAADGANTIASRADDYRGPPAIFPTSALRAADLSGDKGARGLLADAHLIDLPSEAVTDFDRIEDFARYTVRG